MKKAIGQQATCYKKTGAACADTDDKLIGASSKAGDGIRKKCDNATTIESGYGPYNVVDMSIHMGDRCLQLAEVATQRTFGQGGSLYTAADDDGKKCLVAAAKANSKYLSGALGDISKCLDEGCTYDYSERATAAVEGINKKCDNFLALTGSRCRGLRGLEHRANPVRGAAALR